MKQRKYSVSEIDRMRAAMRSPYDSSEAVEQELRTYMLNGSDVEEVVAFHAAKRRELERRIERSISAMRAEQRKQMSEALGTGK
jgi:hypothetical protein